MTKFKLIHDLKCHTCGHGLVEAVHEFACTLRCARCGEALLSPGAEELERLDQKLAETKNLKEMNQ